MLKVQNLGFSFDPERPLFKQVSFKVGDGESCAVFGPSGIGKSTLLGLVGGLISPDQGNVTLDGEPIDAKRSTTAGAWVTQHLHLMPARSVIDNALIQALIDGEHETRARVRAEGILTRLGLSDRLEDKARILSGGERQRLVLARALVSTRRLLLADEPTSQLDRTLSELVVRELMSALEPGRILLVVTHDPELAEACDQQVALGTA